MHASHNCQKIHKILQNMHYDYQAIRLKQTETLFWMCDVMAK